MSNMKSGLVAAVVFGATFAVHADVPQLKSGEVFAPVDVNAGASIEPLVDTDEVFPAAYVEDFKLDGDMTKDVWKKAKPVPELFNHRAKAPIACKGDIRILYSKTAIYIGATLWQDMSKMTAKWDQRDMHIWNDDNIEIFIHAPSDKGNRLYHYAINPINAFADLCDDNMAYWTRGNKHVTKRFADRWTMELKLPFAGIPMERPLPGDFIGIRFCRAVHEPTRTVGASPRLLSSGNNARARFAKLLFEKPSGPDAARLIAEGEAYRREAVKDRFYRRFDADKARFDEVRHCAAAFRRSTHPIHVTAWAGVRQMSTALAAFEKRFSAELSARSEIPEAEARAILAQFAGFWAFASKYAYMVWTADPWERGAPDALPPPDAQLMPTGISFEQAGNEREQVCLCIAGVLCGPRLDLRLHPQSVERTKKRPLFVSTDCFEVYAEPFIRFSSELITAPHVRAPGNMVVVSPGRTTRVWVVFNSRGVSAGQYDTSLWFKCAYDLSVADRSLPMGVTVWNFALPETRDWPVKGFFWGPNFFASDEVALLELTHDYHVTHGWTQQFRYKYGLYDDRRTHKRPNFGKGKVDPSRDFDEELALHANEAFFRRAKELGMRFVFGWGTPTSLDWFKIMTKRLRDMGFEYEDFVYKSLLKDEFTKKAIPTKAAERAAVWNWNTNLYFQAVYLSTPPPTGATMDDIEEAKLPEFYKMWTVIDGRCRDPEKGPDTINRLKKKGCKVWTYRCSRFMQSHSILGYYRFYPWSAYMNDLEGFAFWTVYSPHGDDGWDSRDGYDEGVCWRGLDKKPMPTKKFEAVREGLEDVAYMDRLAKELARHKATGRDFPKFQALLDEREAVIKANDQKRVDAWRLAVGRAIDQLVADGAFKAK